MFKPTQPAPVVAPLSLLSLTDIAAFSDRPGIEAAIRERATYAYLGDRTGLVRVLGRYKMFVNTDDVSISPHLILEGFWEIWNTAAIARLVKPGMQVLEVGAHLGYFALLMSDLAGPTGAYIGFEPNPRLAGLLERSLLINGFGQHASVKRLAAFSRSERRLLQSTHGQFGGASIMHPGAMEGAGISEAVDTVRLDEFCRREAFWPDFIKIDAEGAERDILEGMDGLIQRGGPLTLVIEFDAARFPDWRSMLARLEAAGFALSRMAVTAELEPFKAADADFAAGDLFEVCAVRG